MKDRTPPLSPEKMRAFDEFIWRAMGRLDGAQWHDLLDAQTELGKAARAYYAELAEGRHWIEMADYLAPLGSDALPERLPEQPPLQPPLQPSDLEPGD